MRKKIITIFALVCLITCLSILSTPPPSYAVTPSPGTYEAYPPFLEASVPPLVMLVMGRNHKLYYEAYNDASDLDGDGSLDVTYKPDAIDYYGYYDSFKYYEYVSTDGGRFEPRGPTVNASGTVDGIGKMAPSGDYWSGDFLNYLTMSRMDAMRKVLYGGKRSTDTDTDTVLERAYIPRDAHSWGKEYQSIENDGYDITRYTPLSQPIGASRHIFANTAITENGLPKLRVLKNSGYRVWEWVAIERPVASDRALNGGNGPMITDNTRGGAVSNTTVDIIDNGGFASDNVTSSSTVYTDGFEDTIDASWVQVDHTNGHPSMADIIETGGQMTINAGGADVWTGSDEFAAIYRDDVNGNFDVQVKVDAQENTNAWAKCGIMVRNDMTGAGSASGNGYVAMARTPGNGYSLQYDADGDGFLDNHVSGGGPAANPVWLRLTKTGTTYTGYYSVDGTTWTNHATRTIASADTVQDVGLFVTSHDTGDRSLCEFDDFTLVEMAGTDPSFAFDNNAGTEWNVSDEPTVISPAWIQFALTAPERVLRYTFTTGLGSEDLDPSDWTLYATNDHTVAIADATDPADWAVVDSVVLGGLPSGRNEAASFTCGSPPAEGTTYKYYRFVFTGSKSSTTAGVALAEIEMMTTTDDIPNTADLTDYTVRVQVCVAGMLESNSKTYPNGNHKPIGLLQRHGENDGMYFGLMSGSYTKNTSGGVLRKRIGTITDEIEAGTGQFSAVSGIIKTLDAFRIVDFDYGNNSYNSNCGWIATRPINEGECRMWGNPIGEMMYETLRYFSGAGAPTSAFTYADADDNAAGTNLSLPKPDWNDPYDTADGGFDHCAKPFMLVLSDINPTFDSDQLPGAHSQFGSMPAETIGGAGTALDVESRSDDIFAAEETSGDRFIGQQAASYDGACSQKSVDGFGDIRGLCPEEPTKQGSYYSAAVANYGRTEDMHATADGDQNVYTYAVGLASPLPRIEIPLMGKTVTMVPFGKSVGGYSINSAQGEFQPTNTIVDFFVDTITPYYGSFRINYEDVEQGADHDMDAIVRYEYQLVDGDGNPVNEANIGSAVALDITLTSEYAAGSIDQHLGYIISGTTTDGMYLEVKDRFGANVNYFLDTPNDPNVDLPLVTTRRFTVDPSGGTLTAGLLTNPLWYAAKWGGFEDENESGTPDETKEWDQDSDGDPDTYFYVVNPLKLEEQLNKSFKDIADKAASGTAASVLATNSEGDAHLIQAYFKPTMPTDSGNQLRWLGYLQSLWVDPWGNLREDSNQNGKMDLTNSSDNQTDLRVNADRIIVYTTDSVGDTKVRLYKKHYMYHPKNGLHGDCYLDRLSSPIACEAPDFDTIDINGIIPIFEAGDQLRQRDADTRKIFTFLDGDGDDDDTDGLIDESGEDEGAGLKIVGQVLAPFLDIPFDDNHEVVRFHEDNLAELKPFLDVKDAAAWDYLDDSASPSQDTRTQNLINYIRGKDSADLIGTPGTRTRTTDDGTVWKLGDIINSTPVSISKPPDYYHLIYGDESFQHYMNAFKDRETVVYVGGNDGMLHAFTSWIYTDGKYEKPASGPEALGDELWAYIPQTLLPHLKFLADPEYTHSYYVDLKPKIFDAQIIPDGTHYSDSDGLDDWGTILLIGLNMGGMDIDAEGDFDGDPNTVDVVRKFRPTYVCMDVTDPRHPRLLWERSYDNLAMSASFPAALAVGKARSTSSGTHTWDPGTWMVAFGSGPTDYDGSSDQNGYVFFVDLKTGEPQRNAAGDDWRFETGTANTVMNSPVAFDKNLTYNVDGIYFGTTADAGGGGLEGKVFKVNTHDNQTPSDDTSLWTMTSMFNSPGPITAPISLSTDKQNNVWAFFGTGRYFSNADKMDAAQQYFFGVKDPYFNTAHTTAPNDHYLNTANPLEVDWATQLFNATPHQVHTNRKVTGGGIATWSELLTAARAENGWKLALESGSPSERVISKATVLGGIVFFPGYTPNEDICGYGGDTNFYATYYETGTAYYKHILPGAKTTVTIDGESTEAVNSKYFVGHGAPPPAAGFHVGRESGATAFLQMSTGEVVKINVDTAFPIKSGIAAWRDKAR